MDAAAYNQEHYGKTIREARQRKGMLQSQLAERLNVSPNLVGHWEKGRARPDLNLIPQLCGALGISLEAFFTGRAKKSDPCPEEQRLLSLYRMLPEADRLSLGVTASTPKEVMREMGNRMGADFSDVQFHSDSLSMKRSQAMGA